MVSLDMDDDGESNTSSATTDNVLSGMNGGTTSGRSVSNTLHDRSRLMSTSAPSVNGGSTTIGRHQQSHQSQSTRNSASSTSSRHHHHHSSSRRGDGERISSTSSSTSTAKESFLNYFFGQNGPGPVAGANITNMSNDVHSHLNRIGGAVGRDVSGPDLITNAFMRPRNGPTGDGSDAAFDMKSLGKHIEAVSSNPFLSEFRLWCLRTSSTTSGGFLSPILESSMAGDGLRRVGPAPTFRVLAYLSFTNPPPIPSYYHHSVELLDP